MSSFLIFEFQQFEYFFQTLEVVSRKKPCKIRFQAPTLSCICKLCSFKEKNRMRSQSPPSFVRIIDHTLGLTKYILGGTQIFTLVSLYPIYDLFTISYLSGVFVGHLPAMKLKHQYTNKGNRLSISFKRLKLFLARSYARFPSRLPRFRAFVNYAVSNKKTACECPPSFVRIIDHTLGLTKYILGVTQIFTLVSLYPIYNLFTISYLSGVFVGQLPVMELKRQYTDKEKRTQIITD